MENKLKKKIIKNMIRAIKQYKMIEEGDVVAVGISGGKDSLMLLDCLATIKSYRKVDFKIIAITINQGLEESAFNGVKEMAKRLDIPYHIINTDIFKIIFDIRQEKNPCSLCAKMRRGALCDAAKSLGANKIALGHHADDLVETFMLSFIYEGRLSAFMPVTYMDRSGITSIRPMMFVSEKDISCASKDFPVVHNPCPADKHTNREYVKDILKSIKNNVKVADINMLSAITHPERYNLLDKFDTSRTED